MFKLTTRAMLALLLVALLGSCEQLFTTSLAKPLARDSYDLSDISLDEALSYLSQATENGDIEMATALVAPLLEQTNAATTAAAYDEAATALVTTVILSTGIGQAINSGMDILASSISDGTTINTQDVAAIIDSVTVSAASVDALLLISGAPPPSMDATQAYSAAATLLLSIVESTSLTLESDFSEFDALTGAQAASFDAAQALFNHATDNLNGADTIFGDFFGTLPFLAP